MFTRIMARLPLGTRATVGDYRSIDGEDSQDEDHDDGEEDVYAMEEDKLVGWRVCWMWFPALFDSKSPFPLHGCKSLIVTYNIEHAQALRRTHNGRY